MTSGLIAYIDESGCEGWDFGRGASDWFVLSAVVVPAAWRPRLSAAVQEAKANFGNKKTPFHYHKLNPGSQSRLLDHFLAKRYAVVGVCFNKRYMIPERFARRDEADKTYRLYFYGCKLLLERLSDFGCAIAKGREPSSFDLMFAKRTVNYLDLRAYLRLLERASGTVSCSIDWRCISPDRINALSPSKSDGLQIADSMASALRFGVDTSHKQHCIEKAARLQKHIYHSGGNLIDRGLKIFPYRALKDLERDERYGWMWGK